MNDELHLIPYGWAPGGYGGRCPDCGQQFEGEKRCRRCKACAQQLFDDALKERPKQVILGTCSVSIAARDAQSGVTLERFDHLIPPRGGVIKQEDVCQ
jgi:uncharacterized protein (DUF983 family)